MPQIKKTGNGGFEMTRTPRPGDTSPAEVLARVQVDSKTARSAALLVFGTLYASRTGRKAPPVGNFGTHPLVTFGTENPDLEGPSSAYGGQTVPDLQPGTAAHIQIAPLAIGKAALDTARGRRDAKKAAKGLGATDTTKPV